MSGGVGILPHPCMEQGPQKHAQILGPAGHLGILCNKTKFICRYSRN